MSQEKEDNLIINYLYSPEGKVTLADFSDGKEITYDYYPDDQLLKVGADDKATYYTLDGDVEKITSANQTVYDMNQPSPSAVPAPRSGYTVQYNINNDVGVTNAHSYYGLAQDGFNCYSFAIGRMENSYNPGMFSGLGLNLNSVTGIKYNVEQDQRALERNIYNSGVNDSIAFIRRKNPNNVTWDTYYKPWTGNWKVDVSGYYNSSNYYMTIRG